MKRLFKIMMVLLVMVAHPSLAAYKRSAAMKPLYLEVHDGDYLLHLFEQAKLDRAELYHMLALGEVTDPLRHLYSGQVLDIKHKGGKVQSLKMVYGQGKILFLEKHSGHFVATLQTNKTRRPLHVAHITIHKYLSIDGRKKKVPQRVLLEAGHLFTDRHWEHPMQLNDHIDVLYSDDGHKAHYRLEAMHFDHHAHNAWWIRFTDRHGVSSFYDEHAHNLGYAFDRWPLTYQWVSSPFSWNRLHPVLNKVRPHKGVDLAANRGTEVWATGDGVITFFGFNGGYGRMVKIKHGPHITTVYAHFSRFAKGLHKGQRVKRHQVIGYVGQSGVATGSHCHYEYRINHVPYDPMTVKLPSAHSLGGHDKVIFMHARLPRVRMQLTQT